MPIRNCGRRKNRSIVFFVIFLSFFPPRFYLLVPSHPASIVVVSRELTSITVEWKPPEQLRGLFTSIFYEVSYMERGSLFDDNISLNSSVQYRLKITNLKSKTCYIIKVRAGRRSNYGEVYWSGYSLVRTNTLQEGSLVCCCFFF